MACAQANEVLTAVARRKPFSEDVSAAIVKSLDIPAVTALLVNPDASIRKETLERILEQAEDVSDWHLPLALRADLSARAIRRIAGFVGATIIERLAARHDLSDVTRQHLSRELRLRLAETDLVQGVSRNREGARPGGENQAGRQAGRRFPGAGVAVKAVASLCHADPGGTGRRSGGRRSNAYSGGAQREAGGGAGLARAS